MTKKQRAQIKSYLRDGNKVRLMLSDGRMRDLYSNGLCEYLDRSAGCLKPSCFMSYKGQLTLNRTLCSMQKYDDKHKLRVVYIAEIEE